MPRSITWSIRPLAIEGCITPRKLGLRTRQQIAPLPVAQRAGYPAWGTYALVEKRARSSFLEAVAETASGFRGRSGGTDIPLLPVKKERGFAHSAQTAAPGPRQHGRIRFARSPCPISSSSGASQTANGNLFCRAAGATTARVGSVTGNLRGCSASSISRSRGDSRSIRQIGSVPAQ